jgi:hypothetical protein
MITKSPSFIIVSCTMNLSQTFTMILKGMYEGRKGVVRIFQSMEITSLLGGGSERVKCPLV